MNVDDSSSKTAMLEAQIAALTQQLALQERLYRDVVEERDLLRAAIDAMPIGVGIIDAVERVHVYNSAMTNILGNAADVLVDSPIREVLLPDGQTKTSADRDPVQRALRGQSVDGLESIVRHVEAPDEIKWITQSSEPIRDDAGRVRACVVVTRDITEHKELVRELDEVVAATVEEKRLLIEKLEAGVKELSTPIIEVWDDVLALPVIGSVDARRGAEMTARVLEEVVSRSVQCVIVDWTGVEAMDAESAQHLLDLVRCVQLVGAECILTGIRPAVATALLDLDVRFEHMRLLRNVKFGLRYCLERVAARRSRPKSQTKGLRSSSSSTH